MLKTLLLFPSHGLVPRLIAICIIWEVASFPARASDELELQAAETIRRATQYFHDKLAVNGGYVYHYVLDAESNQPKIRWGEGLASPTQVWVQPPGTPQVGMAFLRAYEATGDKRCLGAALAAGDCLRYGQLKSGGWTNLIDFDPKSRMAGLYRNGRGKGKNNSSLDDDQTPAAIRFLLHLNRVTDFKHDKLAEATDYALNALLKAQFPNGGFPQVWTGPVDQSIEPRPASFPDYDWRTENRIKDYWTLYTINDNVTGNVAKTLKLAWEVTGERKYLVALKRLGDFLILAQMPSPQPGWAQQYDYKMRPTWARKFEPPAISGDETQESIEALMLIFDVTKNEKYLAPIPKALRWLSESELPNGQIARFYELQSNRPLYMKRNGKRYSLTYRDDKLPSHYGWKINSRVEALRRKFVPRQSGKTPDRSKPVYPARVQSIVDQLEAEGHWLTRHDGSRLVGQPKIREGQTYVSSEVFCNNIELLCRFLEQSAEKKGRRE